MRIAEEIAGQSETLRAPMAWTLMAPKASTMDVLERMLLNVNMAGISLDGRRFFYENMLRRAKKLSYELLNRDLIRFVHASKTVKTMLEEGVSNKKIRAYIVSSKFRTVIGSKKLTEAQALKMADLLDEVSPKSVFKALDGELRRLSAAKKRR